MKNSLLFVIVAAIAFCLLAAPVQGQEDTASEKTADDVLADLEQMCSAAQEAMELRQVEKPLYQRLGGRDGIHSVVEITVQRHLENDAIRHLFDGVDLDRLVEQVTDFLSGATGGDVEYRGRDMVAAHAHLGLGNAEFVAAGSDVGAAMTAAGVGADEQQEVMCAFVSLSGAVITR
jgi:hemoglobin